MSTGKPKSVCEDAPATAGASNTNVEQRFYEPRSAGIYTSSVIRTRWLPYVPNTTVDVTNQSTSNDQTQSSNPGNQSSYADQTEHPQQTSDNNNPPTQPPPT